MASRRRRTIVRSARFEEELEAIVGEHRVREALRGVLWFLEHAPDRGLRAGDRDVWAIRAGGVWDVPEMVFFYFFDDETVELESVSVVPEDEDG